MFLWHILVKGKTDWNLAEADGCQDKFWVYSVLCVCVWFAVNECLFVRVPSTCKYHFMISYRNIRKEISTTTYMVYHINIFVKEKELNCTIWKFLFTLLYLRIQLQFILLYTQPNEKRRKHKEATSIKCFGLKCWKSVIQLSRSMCTLPDF